MKLAWEFGKKMPALGQSAFTGRQLTLPIRGGELEKRWLWGALLEETEEARLRKATFRGWDPSLEEHDGKPLRYFRTTCPAHSPASSEQSRRLHDAASSNSLRYSHLLFLYLIGTKAQYAVLSRQEASFVLMT